MSNCRVNGGRFFCLSLYLLHASSWLKMRWTRKWFLCGKKYTAYFHEFKSNGIHWHRGTRWCTGTCNTKRYHTPHSEKADLARCDCEKTNRCKSYRTISINGMLLAICRASIAIANATAGSSEQTAADGITFVFLTIPPCFVCVRDPVRTAAEQPVPRQFLIGWVCIAPVTQPNE